MVIRPAQLVVSLPVLAAFSVTFLALPLMGPLLARADETTTPTPPPPVETAPSVAPDLSLAPPEAEKPEPTPTPEPTDVATQTDEPKLEETPAAVAKSDDESRDARAESILEARRNRGIPAYQLTRPNWGVEIAGSASALGGKDIVASQAGNTTRAMTIQFEYQPAFLQSIGVLGFGPSVSLYPILPAGSASPSAASNWAVGGQMRYQARFFREQIFVPLAGFEAQMLRYNFNSTGSGSATLAGPFFGGMLLLNVFEPSSAAEMYIDSGISRSYLVAELKNLSGADGGVSVSGSSLYFGLRFEF